MKFLNGVKWSYIYVYVLKNFCLNLMFVGFCNLCDDFGYFNFDFFLCFFDELKNEGVLVDLYL